MNDSVAAQNMSNKAVKILDKICEKKFQELSVADQGRSEKLKIKILG